MPTIFAPPDLSREDLGASRGLFPIRPSTRMLLRRLFWPPPKTSRSAMLLARGVPITGQVLKAQLGGVLARWIGEVAVWQVQLQIAGGFEAQRKQALGPGRTHAG